MMNPASPATTDHEQLLAALSRGPGIVDNRGMGMADTGGLRALVHKPAPALLVALTLVAGCTAQSPQRASEPPRSAAAPGAADGATLATVPEVVDRVAPSVVTILRPGGGLGSGVVYRADGLIVTNAHVVGQAQDVTVVFADGSRVEGTVVAADRTTDLAVVRVPRDGLPAPEYVDTLPVQGELAIAIGTPLGFTTTVTVGVVSGLGREIPGAAAAGQRALVNLIQTDAAISPGNSGGALVDGQGRVIGINEAYIPPEAGAVSIGFAIPSTTVVDVVDQLLATGTVEHPFLGVGLRTVTPRLRDALGVAAERGAIVVEIAPGGPAADSGLRPGDVIVRFAGQDVGTVTNLLGALRSTEPGQAVPVLVVRDGERVELSVTVGQRPQ